MSDNSGWWNQMKNLNYESQRNNTGYNLLYSSSSPFTLSSNNNTTKLSFIEVYYGK